MLDEWIRRWGDPTLRLASGLEIVAVERPRAVRVEGYDLGGRQKVLEVDGFGASLLQHEIDHLDGILALDRAAPEGRRRAIRALTALAA